MLKEETNDAYGDDGGNNWSRPCGTCRSAACNASIHAANRVATRHERVRICEACERAPAAFICKADAASLCTTCDAEIHSANPLARRHIRVPILPISAGETDDGFVATVKDEDEAASWLLPNPGKNNSSTGFLFGVGGEVDEYMDLMEYNNSSIFENQFTDSVVPIQSSREANHSHLQHQNFQYGLEDYDSSKPAYSYNGSITHSVSISSVDIGVVPDSTMTERPSQLSPMDREARVLRYREKKKTRKFEKTIRYASRKAYAETRPRIKGRFAKRMDVEVEVDRMFSTSLMTENGYGIVPSF